MARRFLLALVVALSGLAASEAFGLGADHGKAELEKRGKNCVHGFWVNGEDIFFFTGDAAAFNKVATDYGKQQKTFLKVVIHPGTKKARSPWDKADRDIPVDWKYYTGGTRVEDGLRITQLDVWVGGKVKLPDVRIPANVLVTSSAPGVVEIDRFVAEHQKARK